MSAVRLQDVADLAGVSLKTASNVVRNMPHVSERTRARVQKAVEELGYSPNMTARRLATGKTGVIELAFPELRAPYYAELADRMSIEAAKLGYRLFIQQTRNRVENERAILTDREQGLVDGVIFEPKGLNTNEIALSRGNMPLVLLGEVTPPLSVDHVMIDNIAAANTATEYLISIGCKRIAFMGSDEVTAAHTVQRRLVGYETALQNAGWQPDPNLYLPVENKGINSSVERADRAVTSALKRGITFDGLFCYNDFTAIGAMRALRNAGLSIPGDVSVVGWNDILMTRYSNPTLTTISPDMEALCSQALTMLMERISGFDGIGRHELVGYDLTIRESTRAKLK